MGQSGIFEQYTLCINNFATEFDYLFRIRMYESLGHTDL